MVIPLCNRTACHRGKHHFRRAILLIECLVYIAVLGIIFGLSGLAFYRGLQLNQGIRSNADDIVRTIAAGERWREDVRAAVRLTTLTNDLGTTLSLEHAHEERIEYAVREGTVLRRATGQETWTRVLGAVKSSHFHQDARLGVSSWRWELELPSNKRAAERVTPRFTFQAVPGGTRFP